MPASSSSLACPWSPREHRIPKEIDRQEISGVVELRKLISLANGLPHQGPAVVSASGDTGTRSFGVYGRL